VEFCARFGGRQRRHSAILSRKQNFAETSHGIWPAQRSKFTQSGPTTTPNDPERGSRDAPTRRTR
jgi:hypothetical protein